MRRAFLPIFLVSTLIFPLSMYRPVSVKANENIIRVPSDFSTIQEAIDAASPESMVLVGSGTYHEHLTINKAVRLVGVDKMSTIIDGDNNGTAITVSADNVFINGFTIRNCSQGNRSFAFGSIHLTQCNNCTISDNIVTQNICNGILLEYSNNSAVLDNLVTFTGKNLDGTSWGIGIEIGNSINDAVKGNIVANSVVAAIYLGDCSSSVVEENAIEDNDEFGIKLFFADENAIHHNTFVNCEIPADLSESHNNTWDNGTEGNYWDDYVGLDDGSNGRIAGDGVGDTGLPHHGLDEFPLVRPSGLIPVLWENRVYPVMWVGNSTMSTLRFVQTEKKIASSVTGPFNTTGYLNVTIPTALLRGSPWNILLDGTTVTSKTVIAANQTHTAIWLAYNHSNHEVQILGTWVIPEYPSPSILVLVMLLTLLSMISYRKKRHHRPQPLSHL